MGGSHSSTPFDGHIVDRWPAVAQAIGTFAPVIPPAVCRGVEDLRAINAAAFVTVTDDGLVALAANPHAVRLTVRLQTPRDAPLDLAAVAPAGLPNVQTVTLEGAGRPPWSTVPWRPGDDYVEGSPGHERHVAAVVTATLGLCPQARSLVLRRCILFPEAYAALTAALAAARLDALTFDDVYWHRTNFDAFGSALRRAATLRTLSGAFVEDRRFAADADPPNRRPRRMRLVDVRVTVLYDHRFWQWLVDDAAPVYWAIHYLADFTGDLLPRTARVGAMPAEAGFLDFGGLGEHCPVIHRDRANPYLPYDMALFPPTRRLYVRLPQTTYRTNTLTAAAVVTAVNDGGGVELLVLDTGVPYPVDGRARDTLSDVAQKGFQTVAREWIDGPMTLCLVLRLRNEDVPVGTSLRDCQSRLWVSLSGGDASTPPPSLWLLPVIVNGRRCLDQAHQRLVEHVRRVFTPIVLPLSAISDCGS